MRKYIRFDDQKIGPELLEQILQSNHIKYRIVYYEDATIEQIYQAAHNTCTDFPNENINNASSIYYYNQIYDKRSSNRTSYNVKHKIYHMDNIKLKALIPIIRGTLKLKVFL